MCHIDVRMRVLYTGQTCLVWRSRLVSGCLPQILFILSVERESLAESGACRFSWTDWLGSLQDLPVYLCSYQLQAHGAPPSAFYNGSGDINSGSRALGMSTLPTEPPPQPLCTTKGSRLPFYSTNTCEHIQETSSHRWWAKINLSLIWIQYESTLFWSWHSSANLHLGDCGGKTAVDLGLFWTVRLYLKTDMMVVLVC